MSSITLGNWPEHISGATLLFTREKNCFYDYFAFNNGQDTINEKLNLFSHYHDNIPEYIYIYHNN